MNTLSFGKYIGFFSLLFMANSIFLILLNQWTANKKQKFFHAGFTGALILSLISLFYTFRPHFEQYSERMNQFHVTTLLALSGGVIILAICGSITDRKTSWSLTNGAILLPLSFLLVMGEIELVQIRIFLWVIQEPGILFTTLIIFLWLFLVIGFFEILSSSDWLFILLMLFYNSILKVLFYYMDFPPVLLNDFMLMVGLLLLVSKVLYSDIIVGSTLSLPLGLLQALIPIITRLKRFTFITFISPFFLIMMIVIILFINFYWRSLLFRGPNKV